MERLVNGPIASAVDAAADTGATRLSAGARLAPSHGADARHQVEYGAYVGMARTKMSGTFSGTVRESIDTVPARVWTYQAGPPASTRASTTVSVFANDTIALSPAATLDAGIRLEFVHGTADGAATGINWRSLLPHAYLRWEFSDRHHIALVGGYARNAHVLNHDWLAYGDPSTPVASVASAPAPGIVVSRVGPGTGGSPSFSAIDEHLQRPVTDEFVIGAEQRLGPSTRVTLTGIARREGHLVGVLNTGVPSSSYSTLKIGRAHV